MTKSEWLEIGYSKNIIDMEEHEEVVFSDAFRLWFCMKRECVDAPTLDRIEVTYNKYYSDTTLVEKCISKISESDVVDFLTQAILRYSLSYKEFGRCLQIVRSVLIYCKDLKLGGAILYDWDKIKRYVPIPASDKGKRKKLAVSPTDVRRMIESVVTKKIYYEKQSACLCLCMNFYLGLRIGELAGLTFDDFDFERGVVRIYKTESKFYERDDSGARVGAMVYRVVDDVKTIYSVREVPLLPEVRFFYDKIKAHHELNRYDSKYLAYDGKDTILIRSLDRTLRKLCEKCEVPYFNSHTIRKTFATMLHYNGVPTRVVADLLGHSDISTTENSYILSYANNHESMLNYMKGALVYK